MSPPDTLQSLIGSLKSNLDALDTTATSEADKAIADNLRRKGRDRSLIALTIIVTYGTAIVGMFLYVLFTVPSCNTSANTKDCTALLDLWGRQAENLLNVVTVAILPIVTLMLGFYFGTEKTASVAED